MRTFSFIFIACLLASCNASESDRSTSAEMDDTHEVQNNEPRKIDEDREHKVVMYEERKDENEVRLDSLKNRIKSLGPKAKAEWKETVEELELRQNDLDVRMENLKNSSKKAMGDLETAFNNAIDEMEQALDNAEKELKE